MKVKLNVALGGYAQGQTIELKSIKGVPYDAYWRRRLKDSRIDQCLSIVVAEPDFLPDSASEKSDLKVEKKDEVESDTKKVVKSSKSGKDNKK